MEKQGGKPGKFGRLALLVLFSVLSLSSLFAQSVLRTGKWIRIGITKTGPYRLPYETLTRLDPEWARADPRRFQLFGNGGAPLPQSIATVRPADLVENAILVDGEADGRLDQSDALLFWGESPHRIRRDSTTGLLTHTINPYSDTTFYFLTLGTGNGLRMTNRSPGSATSLPAVTSFDHYTFHELEQTSRVASGRDWLGEYFGATTEHTFSFDSPGLLSNSPVIVTSSVVADAVISTKFQIRLGNQLVGTQSIEALSGYRYDLKGRENRLVSTVVTASVNPLRLTVSYDKAGETGAAGYLNFLGVQTQRELRPYDEPVVGWMPPGNYQLQQASANVRVWNISEPSRPVNQSITISGAVGRWANAGRGVYALFTDTQFAQPVSLAPVANQDIRALDTPNLLIIAPPAFETEANRLAAFRRGNDGLTALVVTTKQVYNEFGSGQPDPTAIRDAAHYFSQKAPGTLRYLLLFGDATYDYRNLTKSLSPTQIANTVPVYESRESLDPVRSYSSDDYFGFLKDSDGEWIETNAGDLRLDIGVGRLPVKSIDEARTVVDKLIRYASDRTLAGDWQTQLSFVADDGDGNIHQSDADQLARYVENKSPMRPQRIFTDDFSQESAPGGQRAPAVNQAIGQAIHEGRLIINYAGHGGPSGWAEEQILTIADILSWRNRRLPLLVTATCEFGRYDDPNVNSGAELALLSRQGGAVGLLTTTRPVYANTNFLLNQAFYQSVFTPVNGQWPRLGDVLRDTKNNSLSGSLNRNFALLGDPSMQLAYPQAQIVITKLNGRAVQADRPDTLRAMQTVTLEGMIQHPMTQQVVSDFSGQVRLRVYDKATAQTTRGTESSPMDYRAYTSTIFTGQTSVTNGRFRIQFTVPKDIDYTVAPGRIYTYAIRTDSLQQAAGQYANVMVGGSETAAQPDNTPPSLTLSLANAGSAGVSATQVAGPDVTVRVGLSDNRGINIARTGIGHELTIQLDSNSPVVVNDNYVAIGEDGQRGQILYTFTNLAAGRHTVRVKAWDVNNNSTEGTLTFVVSEKPALQIRTVRAYPNPMIGESQLELAQNRPGETLNWVIQVYDQAGRLVNEQTGQCDQCAETIPVGQWDGRSTTGNRLTNGLYLYRVRLRAVSDGSEAQASDRIMLVR